MSQIVVRTQFSLPFCIDWLPDGRLLVVSGRENLLLRKEPDGSLVVHANLRELSDKVWNEIVVDGRGNTYINGGPGIIALLTSEGGLRQVADGVAFPNGMAITPDYATLIIAESLGKKLSAFEIASDGSLSNRHVWADLSDGVPDGLCLDAEGAISYADVPNKRCVRVHDGDGEYSRVRHFRAVHASLSLPCREQTDRIRFACEEYDHTPRTPLDHRGTSGCPVLGPTWATLRFG